MTCDCRSHNGLLTAKGLVETAQRELEWDGLTYLRSSRRIDTIGSVSGLRRDETMLIFDDEVIDEQYSRYSSSTELVS